MGLVTKPLSSAARGGAEAAGLAGDLLASISLDREYQRKRRLRLLRLQNKNRNVVEGLGRGTANLLAETAKGVAGIFISPFQGARKDGVRGFFKGVATGITGVIARPAAAVVDLAAATAHGTANMVSGGGRRGVASVGVVGLASFSAAHLPLWQPKHVPQQVDEIFSLLLAHRRAEALGEGAPLEEEEAAVQRA